MTYYNFVSLQQCFCSMHVGSVNLTRRRGVSSRTRCAGSVMFHVTVTVTVTATVIVTYRGEINKKTLDDICVYVCVVDSIPQGLNVAGSRANFPAIQRSS